jgi:phosphoglycolate phosphatase
VGLERYREKHGRAIDPGLVTIIGDTPHDVACAKAHRCRSLGVATGIHKVEQLAAAGANHAVRDLSDTAGVLAWLLNGFRGSAEEAGSASSRPASGRSP